MKTFKILWQDNSYGHIYIKAESEDKAIEKFNMGEFDEKDLFYKNGGKEVEAIDEIKDEE